MTDNYKLVVSYRSSKRLDRKNWDSRRDIIVMVSGCREVIDWLIGDWFLLFVSWYWSRIGIELVLNRVELVLSWCWVGVELVLSLYSLDIRVPCSAELTVPYALVWQPERHLNCGYHNWLTPLYADVTAHPSTALAFWIGLVLQLVLFCNWFRFVIGFVFHLQVCAGICTVSFCVSALRCFTTAHRCPTTVPPLSTPLSSTPVPPQPTAVPPLSTPLSPTPVPPLSTPLSSTPVGFEI